MATKTRTKDLKDSGVEWIGKIPQDWSAQKLKYITRFGYGESLPDEKRIEGDVKVYGSNGVVGTNQTAITKGETIIVGRKGSYGKIQLSNAPCFPIDTTFYIDKTQTHHSLRWLYYVLQTLNLDTGSQDSTVPGLSREHAYNQIVSVPRDDEEVKIVSFLDSKTSAIDHAIEQKRKLINLLKEKRTAIINRAVTRGFDENVELVDSGVEWIGKVPKGWRVYKLKFFSQFQSGDGFPDEFQGQETKEIPFFKVSDINRDEKFVIDSNNYVTKEAVKRKGWHMVTAGSVLMAKIGAALAKNHRKVARVDCCIDNNMMAVTACSKIIEPEYLYWIWRNIDIADFQNVSSVPSVNMGMLKEHQYPIPPKSDQIVISSKLDHVTATIDVIIGRVEESINLLNEYRVSLISHVVTGKVEMQ